MAHLVGKRIEVYWDGDARFYKGRVARYAPRTGRHEVAYDDDETEWLRLDRARHRFVDGGGSRYTIEWEWADEKAQGAHAAAVAAQLARFARRVDSCGSCASRAARASPPLPS